MVPGLRKIHDLRLFDLQGIIQLMDKDIPDGKIIPDTAQQQGKDAGDDVDPAISGEKFHPAKLSQSRREAMVSGPFFHKKRQNVQIFRGGNLISNKLSLPLQAL